MEGVAGISRPRRRLFPGSGPKIPLPPATFRWNYAPLRRKGLRAVRSPSFTARFFRLTEQRPLVLQDKAGRAMVMESSNP
jgi:hypothetical protein